MNHFLKWLSWGMALTLFFASGLTLTGCTTLPKNRAASEFLLTTDKATTSLFSDIQTTLDSHKYTVQKQDISAGILLLAPRNFTYNFTSAEGGVKKTLARQNIQMRQEGGSVKVRISYDCNYSGDRKEFVPCLDGDSAIGNKIGRIEASLIDLIQPTMLKHYEDDRATASAPSTEPAIAPKDADGSFDAH